MHFGFSRVMCIRFVLKMVFLVITFHNQLKSTDKLVMLQRALPLA